MDLDELEPQKKKPVPKDLDALGVEQLEEFLAELEAEAARVRAKLAEKKTYLAGAQALQHVGPVDPGGGELDQDLAGAGLGHRPAGGCQHLGSAGLADLDGGHGRGDRLAHRLSSLVTAGVGDSATVSRAARSSMICRS